MFLIKAKTRIKTNQKQKMFYLLLGDDDVKALVWFIRL